MIEGDKIRESKNEFPKVNENLSIEIYHKVKNEKSNIFLNKFNILSLATVCLVIIIGIVVIPIILKNNQTIISDSKYWNNIEYLSDEPVSFNQAMFIAVSGNTVELDEIEEKLVLNTNISNTPIDTIMVSHNKNQKSYFTNNVEIIDKIRNMVNLEYRQINIFGDELNKYSNLIDNGYTVALEINNSFSINFIFLTNGEIILFNEGFCVSVSKINYNSFIELTNQIIKENDNYIPSKDPHIDIDDIDVDDHSASLLIGYDNLDTEDYSTELRGYYKNYKVKVFLDFPDNDLIRNKLTGEMFIPGTNISFTRLEDYYLYLAKDLGFDKFEDLNIESHPFISFNIGDLTDEILEYLLKINSLDIVKNVYFYDDHYYEKSDGPKNYQVIFGNHSKNYLLFNSLDELRSALIENKFYVSYDDYDKLNKYDEEFFEENFLYFIAVNNNRKYLENVELDISIKDINVVFNEIKTSSTTDNDYTNAIFAIEVKRVESISPYEYIFNGKPVSDKLVTLTVNYNDKVFTNKVNLGDLITLDYLNTFVKFEKSHIVKVGMSYDNTFVNVFESFNILSDTEVHLLTTDHSTYEETGVVIKRIYIVYTPDATKNVLVTFDEASPISKDILIERTGLNIDKLYTDSALTNEFDLNVYLPNSYVLWATGSDDLQVERTEINQTITPITYATDGAKYGVNTAKPDVWINNRNSALYMYGIQYKEKYYRFADSYPEIIGEDGDSLWLCILRRAMNPSTVLANYDIKHIAKYDDEAIVVMQITYPNYQELDKESILCYDFIEINGLRDILSKLENKKITFTFDDTFHDDDFYANIELKDIDHTEYDNTVFYQHHVYGQDLEWYDITNLYEENKDKFIYMDGSFSGELENFTKYGFIDTTKVDLDFFKQIFGSNFDFENNYLVVIDRYGRFASPYIASYSLSTYQDGIKLIGFSKEINDLPSSELVSTKYVEIVSFPKSMISRFNGEFTFGLMIVGNNRAVRTTTYTLDGNLYNVNKLLYNYHTDYLLDDKETISVIEGHDELYVKFKELIGYYPSFDVIRGWSSNSPWIYIERTANTSAEINAIYSLISYDKNTHVLKIKRSYTDSGEDDGIKQICYDIVELKGFNLFDIYRIPSDLSIIIIED